MAKKENDCKKKRRAGKGKKRLRSGPKLGAPRRNTLLEGVADTGDSHRRQLLDAAKTLGMQRQRQLRHAQQSQLNKLKEQSG